MALSANLFLRQSQSLVMTPQLMQSIQLLQMTHLELVHFIGQEVEKNPLLEIASNDEAAGGGADAASNDAQADSSPEPEAGLASDWYENGNAQVGESLDSNYGVAFSDDAAAPRIDMPDMLGQWKSMPGGTADGADGYDLDDFVAVRTTLRDHILQQLPFSITAAADHMIALALLDQIDEAGYLRADLDEIAGSIGRAKPDVERVLGILQSFDPPGIFARSLGECLAIQLRQRNRLDPAMATLLDHLELLARRDFAQLKRLCGVDEDDLLDMMAEIRGLMPKPGAAFDTGPTQTIVADVIVTPAKGGAWAVELNPETLPRVLVNNQYHAEIKKQGRQEQGEQAFLSECMQNATWLMRSLDQRARTIMKVATEIVRQQDAFLHHGVDHLRPLNLKTVAEAIKMHESTVSRVTSNKYMLTPRGLFELKYFFSVSIGSAEGGDNHSAEAVRHRIRLLIAQETADNILSDDDIVESLKSSGVDLARRTVAKYREAMNIPSSVQRRREKRAMARSSG